MMILLEGEQRHRDIVGEFPILDEGGTLQGILTRNDVLHVVMQHPKLKLWI